MIKKQHIQRTIVFICIILWCSHGTSFGETAQVAVIFESVQHAVLSAERAGQLVDVRHKEGAGVKKGQVIASLDTQELSLLKKRNEVLLSHLKEKKENLERLIKQGLASNDEVAQSRMEFDRIHYDLLIVKHQISASTIRAPFDCVVIRALAQSHEWVTAGKPVVEVVNPSSLRAVGNIPTHLVKTVKPGQTHRFRVPDLDIQVDGVVRSLVPLIDELSNTATVIWDIQNPPEYLFSGMKGVVNID